MTLVGYIRTRSGETLLANEGNVLKFDFSGMYAGEGIIPPRTTIKYVDVISLLQQGTKLEIAYNVDGQFVRVTPTMDFNTMYMQLMSIKGLVFTGVRPVEELVKQYIFVFNKGSLTLDGII